MRAATLLWLAVLFGAGASPAFAAPRVRTLSVTAYTSLPRQTRGDPHRGAWGDHLYPGLRAVAVSPDLLRHGLRRGTRVFIQGFGHSFVVMDKTAARLRNTVDIYMGEDYRRARRWGRRRLRIRWYDAR